MSLVSDALKKAERDAARREAHEKGLPEPLLAPGQPFRARRRAPSAALVLPLVAAALAIAALAWFALGRRASPPAVGAAAPAAIEETPVTGAAAEAPAGPAGVVTPESPSGSVAAGPEGGSGPARGTAPTPEPPAAAQSPHEANRRPEPAPPSLEPLAPSATTAAQPAPAAAPAAVSAERVFVRTAVLADGSEIRLGGIAWAATAPLAYLNGRLLGVGEFAGAWRVERIERERVVLAGDAGRLVLNLR